MWSLISELHLAWPWHFGNNPDMTHLRKKMVSQTSLTCINCTWHFPHFSQYTWLSGLHSLHTKNQNVTLLIITFQIPLGTVSYWCKCYRCTVTSITDCRGHLSPPQPAEGIERLHFARFSVDVENTDHPSNHTHTNHRWQKSFWSVLFFSSWSLHYITLQWHTVNLHWVLLRQILYNKARM